MAFTKCRPAAAEHHPELLAALQVPLKPIPGEPDLMHHKYVVRDGEKLWARLNQLDARFLDTRGERDRQASIAGARGRLHEQLRRDLETRKVEDSGNFDTSRSRSATRRCGAWFSPGRGEALAHQIAKRSASRNAACASLPRC